MFHLTFYQSLESLEVLKVPMNSNISLAQVIVFLCILISTQIETREDEEQNVKMAETIELLLAAGYFRARIKGLSPFDKVLRWLRKHFCCKEKQYYCWITTNSVDKRVLRYLVSACKLMVTEFCQGICYCTMAAFIELLFWLSCLYCCDLTFDTKICVTVFQVVGGMTWCISVCDFDVDVDLLFQENSTIGQKM